MEQQNFSIGIHNFTCSIFVNAHTVNEYPDTKNTFEFWNKEQVFIVSLLNMQTVYII